MCGAGNALSAQAPGGAERLHNNRLHQTCRPVNQLRHVCVEKCPLTTRHVATRTLRGQLREERVLITLQKLWRSGSTTIQSRRVHDRGKPSRAKTPTTRHSQRRTKVDHHVARRNHDHADGEVASRALEPHGVWRGGERSSSARAKTQHVSEHAGRENMTWVST